jgi:Skp family chaperone for outer membrane proteins
MELRVIDFEVLTRNFQPYVDGYKEIESEKRKMLESVDPDKKELEAIIKRSQSGLVLDEASQKRDMESFRQIQDKLMKLDQDFKRKLKEMSDDLNTNVYDQLSVIVDEWAKANSINLVMGKMEVIFNTDDIDVTNQILEVIKQKELYYTQVETVSGEAVGPQI